MWTCPECGRSFRNTQQHHHCERTTVEDQLVNQPKEIIDIFRRSLRALKR